MTDPTRFVLSALDQFARVAWFTGRAGADLFVSTNIAEAFTFDARVEADRKVASLNEFSALHGWTFSVEEVVTGPRHPHLMTDQELRTARADLIRAKLVADKIDLGRWVAHRQADLFAEQRIRAELGVELSVQGDSFVMEGPSGRHELAVSMTDDRRLSAHWEGFKRENQKRADLLGGSS
jgi:hypothetical protein